MVFKNHILFYQVSVNVLIIKTNPHYLQGFEKYRGETGIRTLATLTR